MTVDLHDRAELAGTRDQRLERGIVQELVAGADEQPLATAPGR